MPVCSRIFALGCALLVGVVGCDHTKAKTHPTDTAEGGAPADTTASQHSPVGAFCEGDYFRCEDSECRSYTDYKPTTTDPGFCSRTCAGSADCPSGFRCTQTANDKLCLPRCSEQPECERFAMGWKCAEAQGERVCANPKARGGEIALRTQLVIDSVTFGKEDQAWRFIPGVWANVKLQLINKGSSGAVTGMGVMSSASKWVEVGASMPDGSWRVRTLAGVPTGEPQQLTYKVADPIGSGTIDVPFFVRSLKSGLDLKPTIGTITSPTSVSLSGWVSGFGIGPALVNTLTDASPPWSTYGDPSGADHRPFQSMGTLNAPNATLGSLLNVTVSESTGSSWVAQIRVVPNLTIFPPAAIHRSELAGGKTLYKGFVVSDSSKKTQGEGTAIDVTSDQPWLALQTPSINAWAAASGPVGVVTEPADPGSAQAWVTLSWNGIELARVPYNVVPDIVR